ncbi:protein myomaker isoform X2 [Moschus berezovskii]|uniref:protein myomaker isoform X2 n=1 Tax=Moschus berezovskii TaxID=68408 RepID=UPI00244492DA|nr:protein myomaker isoform X2 [Moschus berezovskii]
MVRQLLDPPREPLDMCTRTPASFGAFKLQLPPGPPLEGAGPLPLLSLPWGPRRPAARLSSPAHGDAHGQTAPAHNQQPGLPSHGQHRRQKAVPHGGHGLPLYHVLSDAPPRLHRARPVGALLPASRRPGVLQRLRDGPQHVGLTDGLLKLCVQKGPSPHPALPAALADFDEPKRSTLVMFGVLTIAVRIYHDRWGYGVYSGPIGSAILIIAAKWLQQMKETRRLFPDRSVYAQQIGPGFCFGALALMLRFFFEDWDYTYVHSFYHCALAMSFTLLLPKVNKKAGSAGPPAKLDCSTLCCACI